MKAEYDTMHSFTTSPAGCTLRRAQSQDLDAIARLEAACFPPAEAAGRDTFAARLASYGRHFFLLEKEGEILSFVNGPVTRESDLLDAMYDDTSFSCEQGEWQMIFGVVTHPDHQRKGLASYVLHRFIEAARQEGRKGVVLTCKAHKIHFYERFGFNDEGFSGSMHGGVPWHQMRLTF